jgi:hypothetical protein
VLYSPGYQYRLVDTASCLIASSSTAGCASYTLSSNDSNHADQVLAGDYDALWGSKKLADFQDEKMPPGSSDIAPPAKKGARGRSARGKGRAGAGKASGRKRKAAEPEAVEVPQTGYWMSEDGRRMIME